MSLQVFQGQGCAELNNAIQITRVESVGGVSIVAQNEDDDASLVMMFQNEQTGVRVNSDKDTNVSAEDTGYNGDTSDLAFSGQTLNNLPVVPKSVTVIPESGGDSVNATDRDGDGRLYTADNDEDFCGTINYFTGALTLAFPAGKAPNTGDIDCSYTHQGSAIVARGQRTFTISASLPDEHILVYAAASNAQGARCRVDAVGQTP